MPMAIWMAGIVIGLALDPALAQRVETTIEGIFGAAQSGAINPIVNAWFKVALIGGGLGLSFWLIEAKIAKGMGQEVAAPPVQSIGVPAPPTFGSNSGFSVDRGGVAYSQSASATGGGGQAVAHGTPGRPITRRAKKELAFAA